MDKIDLIIAAQKDFKEDLKVIEADLKIILQKLPTYITKEECAVKIKENNNDKKGSIKFIITTIVAIIIGTSGLIIGIINILKTVSN